MSSFYRIGEFAERIWRSVSTVRRWETEGRIAARRTPAGQRYFDDTDIRRVLQPGLDEAARRTVVYCRVSSPGQKDDLASQVAAMEQFCLARGLSVDEWVQEIGGGMKDRLARFGFEYLNHVAAKNGCTIVTANQESLSPQQERVEDLLATVHTFSCRLYGLRRYDKTLRDELTGGTR